MNYLKLFIRDLPKETKKLYDKVKEEYDFDLVVFISKGAFLIGQEMSRLGNCDLIEISAKRKGNGLKKLLKPILSLLPEKLIKLLREKEMKSNYHDQDPERDVFFNQEEWKKHIGKKKILLVDDSVDSGITVKLCIEAIKDFFAGANLRIAVYNVFEKSKDTVNTDYYIYEDTMIQGPWSNDSKENKEFLRQYDEYIKEK